MDISKHLPSSDSLAAAASGVSTLALDLNDGIDIDVHHHQQAQVLLSTQGVLMVTTRSGCWIVPSNYALWIPPGVRHRTRTLGAVSIKSVYLDERTISLGGDCLVLEITPLTRELVIAASQVDGNEHPDRRNELVFSLLLEELSRAETGSVFLPLPQKGPLRDLCHGLVATRTLDWGLAECATHLGVNVKTIQRWFARELGITYGKWRKQARLLVALEELALGRSILDVALEAGYSNPSAFTAMFRREFGIAPTAFQRSQHKTSD
ncbi:AraC family transcriptional regulator [Marinobacter sp. ANT_B65]|uniref:AraC family transcriptional regulator n=1 Tax=Marinobacter sp. ANT_B65 TaxID=2039467 RepID=UPI000BBE5AA6|nr:helix-turn-helix transcriptional regulator [Marinobacter sp. ANT_B65]PCM45561.1 AraC family transcriptional regulator [Marinobacter sp. ANT_B65]